MQQNKGEIIKGRKALRLYHFKSTRTLWQKFNFCQKSHHSLIVRKSWFGHKKFAFEWNSIIWQKLSLAPVCFVIWSGSMNRTLDRVSNCNCNTVSCASTSKTPKMQKSATPASQTFVSHPIRCPYCHSSHPTYFAYMDHLQSSPCGIRHQQHYFQPQW